MERACFCGGLVFQPYIAIGGSDFQALYYSSVNLHIGRSEKDYLVEISRKK